MRPRGTCQCMRSRLDLGENVHEHEHEHEHEHDSTMHYWWRVSRVHVVSAQTTREGHCLTLLCHSLAPSFTSSVSPLNLNLMWRGKARGEWQGDLCRCARRRRLRVFTPQADARARQEGGGGELRQPLRPRAHRKFLAAPCAKFESAEPTPTTTAFSLCVHNLRTPDQHTIPSSLLTRYYYCSCSCSLNQLAALFVIVHEPLSCT